MSCPGLTASSLLRQAFSLMVKVDVITSLAISVTDVAALVLIGVATSLLDRQIAAQAQAFETEGGFTERLYRRRQERRNQRDG